MCGDCMLMRCIGTQVRRKQSSLGGDGGDSECFALTCTVRTAEGAAVHTFALSVRMEKSFCVSVFLTLTEGFRKKTSKLELTKEKK